MGSNNPLTSDGQRKPMSTGTIMKELDRISQKSGAITSLSSVKHGVSKVRASAIPRYPWYIIFILGNELCERFAFYGMKAVLTLYFVETFLWSESTSTVVYHVFLVFSYFMPVFGAMLADGYIGKFLTIFSLSIVYIGGLALMTLASIPQIGLQPIAGFVSGLLLVAIGTGGIKPCVVTYGGDQFVEGQERYRESFFSVFYFCINAGSLISTFVTPILRSDLPCLGKDGCYPAAFGLPAGLMAIALSGALRTADNLVKSLVIFRYHVLFSICLSFPVLFLVGKPFYRNVPLSGNIVGRVLSCIGHAIANKLRRKGPSGKKHWLDYASDTYDETLISDIKRILPILKMFLPLPIFWTLFDQKGSRWTLQANKMDGRITDTFYWKPDQVQIFNPVLVLILVPIFETVIYPTLEKFNIKFRLLARMVTGMLFAGGAFVIAGLVQIQLNNSVPIPPPAGTAELRIFNTMPCDLILNYTVAGAGSFVDIELPPFGMHEIQNVKFNGSALIPVGLQLKNSANCPPMANSPLQYGNFDVKVKDKTVHSVFLSAQLDRFHLKNVEESKEQLRKGAGFVRFVIPFKLRTLSGGGMLTLMNPDVARRKSGHSYSVMINRSATVFKENSTIMDAAVVADQGKYEVYIADTNSSTGKTRLGTGKLQVGTGAIHVVILKNEVSEAPWIKHDVVPPSAVNIFWQLPQYFLITIGEVLFSVSGVAFAYSQAPASMKAVLQAGWLMTTAFGNVLVIIISGSRLITNQATEFFVFAGLIGAFAMIFLVMTKFYKYVEAPVEDNKKIDSATKVTSEEIEEGVDHL